MEQERDRQKRSLTCRIRYDNGDRHSQLAQNNIGWDDYTAKLNVDNRFHEILPEIEVAGLMGGRFKTAFPINNFKRRLPEFLAV